MRKKAETGIMSTSFKKMGGGVFTSCNIKQSKNVFVAKL